MPGIDAKTRFRHYLNLASHGAPPAHAAARFRVGPHGPRCCSERRRGIERTAPSASSEIMRHDPLRTGCRPARADWRSGRSLPAIGRGRPVGRVRRRLPRGDVLPSRRLAARCIERVFGHRTHFLYAERGGRIEGVLPLARGQEPAVRRTRWCRCRSASTAASPPSEPTPRPRSRTRRRRSAQRLGVDHLELRNVARAPSRLADAGSLRHVPQGDRCRTSKPTCSRSRASSAPWCARASRTGCGARSTRGVGPLLRALRRQRAPPRHAGASEALLRGAAARRSATTARC